MANETPNKIPNVLRYLIAIVVVGIFAVVVFSFDHLLFYEVTTYFAAYDSYLSYITAGSNSIVGIVASYVIYRILASAVGSRAGNRRAEIGAVAIKRIMLAILFSFIALFITLTAFGISLTGVLAGSAIGGVVIGLALQTITTSVLSGLLVSVSKTLLPGDVVLMRLSSWGGMDLVVEILHVQTVFTEVRTQNNHMTRIPNTFLLNSVILTHLEGKDGFYYPLTVSLNSDVNGSRLQDIATSAINREFEGRHIQKPEITFLTKVVNTNTYVVTVHVDKFLNLNYYVNAVNRAFDKAYWQLKAAQPGSAAQLGKPRKRS